MRKTLTAIMTLAVFSMFLSAPILTYAQSAATATPPQVVTLQTSDFTGRVIKILNNVITVDANNSIKEITLPGNVRITRNGLTAEIKDIQVGDQVTVTTDNTNNVLKVDVQAQAILEASTMLIVIIPVLLLLAIFVYIYNRNRNQAHIKTAPAQVAS
jgi:hypothetical protein